jgi:hypothetical protein
MYLEVSEAPTDNVVEHIEQVLGIDGIRLVSDAPLIVEIPDGVSNPISRLVDAGYTVEVVER